MNNRCPELYDPKYRNSAPMPMCVIGGQNNAEPLSQKQLKEMCRQNCTSCYKYRNKYGNKPPVQGNTNAGSSSFGSGLLILIIAGAAAFITKQMGLW